MRHWLTIFLGFAFSLGVTSQAQAFDLTSLEAHWKLNEATSAQRDDSHGSNNLTDVNDVEQISDGSNKIDEAAHFTNADSEYLAIADNASLSTGDIDYTITMWVYLDNKSTVQVLMSRRASSGSREYDLKYDNGADRFNFEVTTITGGAVATAQADNFGSPSTATWYFIVAWYDTSDDKARIQINNGTADVSAGTVVPGDGGSTTDLGRRSDGIQHLDGRLDSVSFWKRHLTAQEKTDLYNGGLGIDYDFEEAAVATGFPHSTGVIIQ